jgi:hypothetical protein
MFDWPFAGENPPPAKETVSQGAQRLIVMLSKAKHLAFQGVMKTRFFGCASE